MNICAATLVAKIALLKLLKKISSVTRMIYISWCERANIFFFIIIIIYFALCPLSKKNLISILKSKAGKWNPSHCMFFLTDT